MASGKISSLADGVCSPASFYFALFCPSALVARSLAEREASGKIAAIAMIDPLAEQTLAELPDQPYVSPPFLFLPDREHHLCHVAFGRYEAEFVPSRLRSVRMHAVGARTGLTRFFVKMGMHTYTKILVKRVDEDMQRLYYFS